MATMLNEVLSYHKPATWDSGSYDGHQYRKVQVFGHEYSQVIEKFTPELRERVQLIYRVQNPYIYGRYKLRTEQLQLTNQVYEETWYHPIAEDDMNVIMEYNCDYRRYTQATYAQMQAKKPIFHKSAESAERNFSTNSNKALVVAKTSITTCFGRRRAHHQENKTVYYRMRVCARGRPKHVEIEV